MVHYWSPLSWVDDVADRKPDVFGTGSTGGQDGVGHFSAPPHEILHREESPTNGRVLVSSLVFEHVYAELEKKVGKAFVYVL